jgi:hypothetical protein
MKEPVSTDPANFLLASTANPLTSDYNPTYREQFIVIADRLINLSEFHPRD